MRNKGLFITALAACLSGIFTGECMCESQRFQAGNDGSTGLVTKVPLISKALAIDGVLDEKEWAGAACVSGFVSSESEWPPEQSSAFMATDGKHLYLAMRCLKAPPFEISAQKHPDDSMEIFGDESAEIFIAPDPAKKLYYQLAINACGSAYTAECGETRRESWKPEMEVVCGKFEGGWTLEMKIALASLGAKTGLGDRWKMNFCRNSVLPNQKNSSSWTGQNDFNAPDKFGLCVVAPSGGIGYSVEKIGLDCMEFTVRNADTKERTCELAAKSPFGEDRQKVTVKPLAAAPASLKVTGAKNDLPLSLEMRDDQSNQIKTALVPYVVNKMLALSPSLYYFPEGAGRISVGIKNLLKNAVKIEVSVTGPSSSTPVRKLTLPSGEKFFDLDAKGMQPGRYAICARAVDAQEKALESDEQVFIILKAGNPAPLPENQKFELDGQMIKMNGNLFFPFMVSDSPKEGNASPLVIDSFNVKYGNVGVRPNAALLGSCGYPAKLSREGGTHFVVPAKDQVFERMKTGIEKGGTANFLCRRIQYEAAIPLFRQTEGAKGLESVSPKEEYTACRNFLKKTFPDLLLSIQNDRAKSLPDFVGCADMIEVATPSSYSKKLIRNFAADLAEARATVGDKPLLLWIGASIPSADFRSAENLRAATWLALFGGADGIIYHTGHDGIPESKTRLWSVFKNLSQEVEALHPVAATGKMVDAGLVSCDLPLINLSVRIFQGATYVIAINQAIGTRKARIKINGFESLGLEDKCEALFEGRSIKMRNGEFKDVFTSFEPHAYRVKTKK